VRTMMSLRTKLILGFLPILAGLLILGSWAVVLFSRLGDQVSVILRENYRSIVAIQRMTEALERQDSAFQFAMMGEEQKARRQYEVNRPEFENSLAVEQHNITEPGEQELADDLGEQFTQYTRLARQFFSLAEGDREERRQLYIAHLLPTFGRLKGD